MDAARTFTLSPKDGVPNVMMDLVNHRRYKNMSMESLQKAAEILFISSRQRMQRPRRRA
jgi:hypothetical protein